MQWYSRSAHSEDHETDQVGIIALVISKVESECGAPFREVSDSRREFVDTRAYYENFHASSSVLTEFGRQKTAKCVRLMDQMKFLVSDRRRHVRVDATRRGFDASYAGDITQDW